MPVHDMGKAVLAPSRISPAEAAILATSIIGTPVSVDTVRDALRGDAKAGRLRGTLRMGRWYIWRADAIKWAEARKAGL